MDPSVPYVTLSGLRSISMVQNGHPYLIRGYGGHIGLGVGTPVYFYKG
jgi:hypothetical protein